VDAHIALTEVTGLPSPPTSNTGATADPPPSGHPLVLVVEDDEPIRELMVSALGGEGFHVLAAANGAEALHLVQQARPAVVLLDVKLPGISGLEVARRLKADPATAGIPLVAVSAHADADEVLASGCCALVRKPFDLPDLLGVVEAAVQKPS
jgi:CheY-like chemotaxis protein